MLIGLGDLKHTPFLIDFGVAKEYHNSSTRAHIPFCEGCCLTGTPAFTSINSQLGFESGQQDDLESLAYMLNLLLTQLSSMDDR